MVRSVAFFSLESFIRVYLLCARVKNKGLCLNSEGSLPGI